MFKDSFRKVELATRHMRWVFRQEVCMNVVMNGILLWRDLPEGFSDNFSDSSAVLRQFRDYMALPNDYKRDPHRDHVSFLESIWQVALFRIFVFG